jgi:hypothetical protein
MVDDALCSITTLMHLGLCCNNDTSGPVVSEGKTLNRNDILTQGLNQQRFDLKSNALTNTL